MTEETDTPKEPGRARALLSTADFRLLRAALASHARTTPCITGLEHTSPTRNNRAERMPAAGAWG